MIECVSGSVSISMFKAICVGYPMMGFSGWHQLVANLTFRDDVLGHNAVIVWGPECIVIKGDTFEGTNYFRPQSIAIERSKRFPEGVRLTLPDLATPIDIARTITELIERRG